MKKDYPPSKERKGKKLYLRPYSQATRTGWSWQATGAISGLAGGILFPVLGILLTIIKWLIPLQRASSYLNRLSLVLCVLTIPLLSLGAHCLDLLEAKTENLSPSIEQQSAEAATAEAASGVVHRNGKRRFRKTGVLTVLVLLLTPPAKGNAQQTIFNVPSSSPRPSFLPCRVGIRTRVRQLDEPQQEG